MTEAKDNEAVRLRPVRACPVCGQSSSRATFSHCSERCRDRDLNRWFSRGYAIPVVEEDGGEGGTADDVE